MSRGSVRYGAMLLLCPAVALIASPAAAAARDPANVSAPSQSLSSALQALARQTGVNILFLPGAVQGLQSNPVFGRYTAEEAARRMVAGKPLRVSRDALGGLIVREAPPPAPRPSQASAPAAAAEPAPPPPPPAPTLLNEVVVTATRQADMLSRVPISVTAETQRSLDQRGVRTVRDFEAAAPALRVVGGSGVGTAIIAIRGIVQSGPTAATTGFYLDDVPLQRRSMGGAGGVNGTPQPVLFDLERVEVLRGPQGTLFGSGSEGGTIRLIQSRPSLVRPSSYARAQLSATHHGQPSYEFGVATGGPILTDRLGFRASAFVRRSGGFIDLVDPFTTRTWLNDANSSLQRSARLALTFAPVDNVRATLSVNTSHTESRHALDRMTLPIGDPIVTPTLCYDTRGIENLPITSPQRQTPVPVGRGAEECRAAAAAGRVTYQTPGYTLGPYPLAPYQSIENDVSGTKSNFEAYAFDVEAEVSGLDLKSITAYVQDSPKQNVPQPFQVNRVSTAANLDPTDPRNAHVGGLVIPSGTPFIPFLGPGGFKGPAHFTSVNPRYTFSQELRISSRADARPVNWVAGLFYSNSRMKPDITLLSDSDDYSRAQFGITEVQRYGVPSLPSAPGVYNVFGRIRQSLKDEEAAVFGEVNYWPTSQLKLILGLRVSQIRFRYEHAEIGQSNGLLVATEANGGAYSGLVEERPVTPRFGVQYLIGTDSSVYATVSKGFRAGGVNTPIAQAQAADSLARIFGADFTVFDLPKAYSSDQVWSYEAGAKLRLGNSLQLNSAAYLIDWRDPQTSTLIPQTGASVTTNAERVRSVGLEIEAQAALPIGLTAVAALGVNRTEYTRRSIAFVGSNGVEAASTFAGQRFAVPPVTFNLAARYDFEGPAGLPTYLRGEWNFTAGYPSAQFGSTSWNPDSSKVPQAAEVNLRLGAELGDVDVNLFVNNLFERHSGPVSGGRTGCPLSTAGGTEACASYGAFEAFRYTSWGTPREIGVEVAIRR